MTLPVRTPFRNQYGTSLGTVTDILLVLQANHRWLRQRYLHWASTYIPNAGDATRTIWCSF